jgi:nucleotide-binding universal stress UspA family protein
MNEPSHTEREQYMPGIIVGVDGSGHASQALEWAMKMAAALHLPLTVLTVHQVAGNEWTGNPIIYPQDRTAQEDDRQAAEKAVAEVAGRLGHSSPASVTVVSVSGNAAHELIDASRGADLLVVGSRGGGGFASLLLGSTSSQVVHHAHCPVVVMPRDG